ncbi:ABC transporter permease family protein [Halobiforma nitratireducens]|uniref:Sodium ABC transporter permease n=1 Tax=Halobiforma nitratireducens JCM 10879 TaxID=1227454 RepID=M0L8M2_9EURY|nr:ABC transporter permease [Halobiforma nitratireducens]EMA29428.1 sodium ABC transporter permease [Halobiforma nitratireducens JCM 10879]
MSGEPDPSSSHGEVDSSDGRPSRRAGDETESTQRSRAAELRDSCSRIVRVARWEISRTTGTVDRKTVFVLLAVAIAVGIVGFAAADDGIGLEDEIYVVGVDEENPYHDVATASDQFRTVPLEAVRIDDGGASGNVDVVIEDRRIGYVGENGVAAYDAFRDAVEAYNEALMAGEDDETAAYPVLVEIEYQDRSFDGDLEPPVESEADESDGSGVEDSEDSAEGEAPEETDGEDSASDEDTVDLEGDEDEPTDGDEPPLESDEDTDAGGDANVTVTGSPGDLEPPFPFQSLILAFLFVVPMNFVIQAYGSTIMDERIKRRGELLLVSPASSREIVAGKTLPYLAGLVGIVVAITLAIGGGFLSVAATVPIALLFLAATFAGAMFARSFKELTFVTVTISVVLTTYVFIPAIFTDVTPIALISPLTLVVMDLQGESVTLGAYLVSTIPVYLTAAVVFLLGLGTYREEDMFAQKPVPTKVIDAIAVRVHGKRSVPVLSIVFVPFVFVAQLLAIALLFAAPPLLTFTIIFFFAAAVEEVAKSVHVYAGFSRARFEPTLAAAIVLGTLSGAAFFLAEKGTQIVQLVGLHEFESAIAAFGPETMAGEVADGPVVFAGLLLAPLILHVVTAIISAVGATRGRTSYVVALGLATAVHALYNIGVILLVT